MNVEELVPFTNGLSFAAGPHTLVLDHARLRPVTSDEFDMSFRVAGTDFVPRLRLSRARIEKATPEELGRIVRQVTRVAVTGLRHRRS
ncbi:MAG TPA: hypothetical protein VLD67_19120 [Vicinamibacterales bacterium]|nr:hypothetical protein [Vicinamibacterales bacterium]